ncbi:hypothetical protein KY331_04930 [Candidatus Woesearchaeota archaeon]|nr:hypothetical protein [Candidatus Woesearchaeota archaeon]
MSIPLEQLPMVAEKYYELGENCKHNGDYKKAFGLFKSAAEKFGVLADRTDSTAEKIKYLHMKRQCLTGMLTDSSISNQGMWREIMLEIGSIDDHIIEAIKEKYQPPKSQVH